MFAAYVFGVLYALWVLYLATMNLMRAHKAGSLPKAAKYLGAPVLLLGYLLDAAVNIILLTIILLELPREWLVTKRLSRLMKGDGWRASVACWACQNLLDPFDPKGCHCK